MGEKTTTPRTAAAVARFSYACPPFKPDRIVSATEMERLETDLQHLARVAEQAASRCALVLSGESMSKFELTQALESTRDLLSEIKRIKTKI